MKRISLIVGFLIAATGTFGCGGSSEEPSARPSSKPNSTASNATKPGDSTGISEKHPSLATEEEMPAGSTTVADGESPTESENSDAENSEETADKPDSNEPPASKFDGAVSSVALAREFESGQEAAETKYKGKAIVVEGKVGTYLAKDGYIYLDGSKELRKVICILKAPTSDEIKFGDTVVVKGQFDLVGALGVGLKGCEVVKINP